MIDKIIFKSYDIRGIYPKEINKNAAYIIGQAFLEKSRAKKVIVGRDMRLSSVALFNALITGIQDQGADVFDLGEVPVELVYFTVSKFGYDAGIMITASHNPKEYNGFKMIKKLADGFSIIRGEELAKITQAKIPSKIKKGAVRKIDAWEEYISHVFSFINYQKIKPFKIIIDAGNGMAGKTIPKICSKLPVEIIPLNFELDGNFPSHSPNPLLLGSTDQISEAIKKNKADFGFIFDGDADRVFLIDEQGNLIKGDVSLLILADYFLKKYPGAGIAYNAICSKSVLKFVKKWGGKPIRTKVGFVNVREGMMENKGILGGEASGHFCFKNNFYADSGFIAFLILLYQISQKGKKVSDIAKEFSPYFKSQEINFEVKDKENVLKKIRETFSDAKQDYLDGITIEYNDWWFNVRPSNTEPLLRLTIEANSEKLLKEKEKELICLIGGK